MFGVTGLFMLVSMGVLMVLEKRCPPAARNLGLCE
jgi:hypothetical protein